MRDCSALWVEPSEFRDFRGGRGMQADRVVISGVDPGVTTGYAGLALDLNKVLRGCSVTSSILSWTLGQTEEDENGQILFLKNWATSLGRGGLVIEAFDLHSRVRSHELLSPVRIAAGLEYAIWNVDRVSPTGIHIAYQLPALAMTTATDARLKRAGLYRPGKEHGRDAFRHCITYARRLASNRELLRDFIMTTGFKVRRTRSRG